MDDDRDALAAEYVLGTLAADERDQAEALLEIDPGFAEIVRVWERRLGELNVMVEAVEPPPELWDRIKGQVAGEEQHRAAKIATVLPAFEQAVTQTEAPGGAEAPVSEAMPQSGPEPPQDLDETAVAALASSLLPPEPQPGAEQPAAPAAATGAAKIERSAEVVYLARQARRWRSLTVAMSAIAALLAIYVGLGQWAPGLLPRARQAQAPAIAQAPAASFVAVLQQEPTAPAFLLSVDPQNRAMTVRRMTAAPDPGRSYELWLIPGPNQGPRSLGLIGGTEFTSRALPPDLDAEALRTASYAVSLEPAGGSPKGVPSGPILFTGKMVDAVPSPLPKGS